MLLKLATKEMLRKKTRFFAVAAIVGFITLLVLFIAAMGDGLALASKEYIENSGADLIVFRDDVDFSIPASRLGRSKLNDIARVEGVEAVGPIGFSTATILLDGPGGARKLDVGLVGVEVGEPGMPGVVEGSSFSTYRAGEAIIDRHVLDKVDIPVGTTIDLKVVQGTKEKVFSLEVVGHTGGQYYLFAPSIFVPLRVWDQIRPQDSPGAGKPDILFNVAAVRLAEPGDWRAVTRRIESQVGNVQVTDPVTAYETTMGYKDMQSIIDTQQMFVLLIALLVIGAFFQIQTLHKVGQIGMLKAIGMSTPVVAAALLLQIALTTSIGVLMGGVASLGLSLIIPPSVPLVFSGQKVATTIVMLLVIGPLAGLASVRTLAKIEPLTAMGLER